MQILIGFITGTNMSIDEFWLISARYRWDWNIGITSRREFLLINTVIQFHMYTRVYGNTTKTGLGCNFLNHSLFTVKKFYYLRLMKVHSMRIFIYFFFFSNRWDIPHTWLLRSKFRQPHLA